MRLYDYLETYDIEQYYNYNNLPNEYFSHLKEYTDLTKNTLFICSTKFDIQLINFHKGKKWIFLTNEFNLEDINLINKDSVEKFFCDSEHLTENLDISITNIKTKISNYKKIKNVKTEDNIVYLILASKKEGYEERYNNLCNKLKDFKSNYIILLSDNNEPKLSSSNELKENILYVDIEDIYENIPKKVIAGIKWIYYNTYYSHIYKVDDNFFEVNINTKDEILKKDYYGNYIVNKIKRDYHFGKCHDDDLNKLEYENKFFHKYAAGGYGYLISRKAMYVLIKNEEYIKNEMYEDKAIGDVLYKNNIIINQDKYNEIKYTPPKNDLVVKNTKNNRNKTTKNCKCAVILFHKNLKKLYKARWIKKCVETVLQQSYQDFDILEVNYGNDSYSIMEDYEFGNKHYFYQKNYSTHTEAMFFLLNLGFCKFNYDVIFNTNLDDYYTLDRFEKQLECLNDGFVLCSSLMNYITEDEEKDEDYETMKWTSETYGMPCQNKYIKNDQISVELNKIHNVMNHSCICYSKDFWNGYDKFENLLRYRDDKPYEDLTLWTRAVDNDYQIAIINEPLIEYRLHANQIGEQKKKNIKDKYVDTGFKKEPDKQEKRIGIFCIGTGNYIQYLDQLIESIEKYFLTKYKKVYIISTDQVEKAEKTCNKYEVKHSIKFIHKKGFPLDTLYRYKYLLAHDITVELLCDVLYYFDIDMRVVDTVGSEVLPTKETPLIGTRHPGFAFGNNKNGSPETSELSTAYINPSKYKECYIAGGFNGGITHYFIKMAEKIQSNINIDKINDVIAQWHDESQLNRYFIDNFNKFKVLCPDYCYPEKYHEKLPGDPKILALDKPHHIIRNQFKKNRIVINVMGGLGNILFQIFFGYTIALRYNLEVSVIVDQKKVDPNRTSIYNYFLFDNILRIKYDGPKDDEYVIKEECSHYTDILSDIPMKKNVYLYGFFQSGKYFVDYFDRIKSFMNFEIKDIASNIIKRYKNSINKNIIGLHIRGTDYIKLKNYHYNNVEYYEKVLAQIEKSNSTIVLFTDDYEYAKNNFKNKYEIYINDIIDEYLEKEHDYLKNSPELSMFLLSECDKLICANSTFSLWASYFSNSPEIYLPRQWFGVDGPKDFISEDLKLNDNYIII